MRRFPYDRLLLANQEVIEQPMSQPITLDFSNELFHNGLSHHQKGEMDKAEIFYKKILEINPDPIPDVYKNLVLIQASTDKQEDGPDTWIIGNEKRTQLHLRQQLGTVTGSHSH